MSATAGTADPSTEIDRPGIARWIAQPLLVAAIVVAAVVYVRTGDLTANERATLALGDVTTRTREHLVLSLQATVATCVIAIPFGIVLTRGAMRRYRDPVLAVSGFGQSAPVVGLLVIAGIAMGLNNPLAPLVALTIYGILPIVANTVSGINGVDARLVEASRGMGMTSFMTLLRVELPLALPVIVAGIRTALVLMVGAAALAFLIGGGGLGVFVDTGIKRFQTPVLIVGALLICALALTIDWLARIVEIVLSPRRT